MHWVENVDVGTGPHVSTALHESVKEPHSYPSVAHVA